MLLYENAGVFQLGVNSTSAQNPYFTRRSSSDVDSVGNRFVLEIEKCKCFRYLAPIIYENMIILKEDSR